MSLNKNIFNDKADRPPTLNTLMNALRDGDIAEVERLLKEGACINEQDKNGTTPLMSMVINMRVQMVQVLINHGADLNIQTKDGTTALMFAVICGYKEITRLLLDNGADPDRQDHKGYKAFDYVARSADVSMMDMLISIAQEKEKKEALEKKQAEDREIEREARAAVILKRNIPPVWKKGKNAFF